MLMPGGGAEFASALKVRTSTDARANGLGVIRIRYKDLSNGLHAKAQNSVRHRRGSGLTTIYLQPRLTVNQRKARTWRSGRAVPLGRAVPGPVGWPACRPG